MIAIIRITAEKDTHQQPTYIYLFINHLGYASTDYAPSDMNASVGSRLCFIPES